MKLLPINTTDYPLTNISERELPFCRPNWDPFHVGKEWERIVNDSEFSDVLREILDFNMPTVQQEPFSPPEFTRKKMLYADDVSLQAFFISWEEFLHETGKDCKIYEMDLISGIPNFPNHFKSHGKWERLMFHDYLIFSLGKFQDLITVYERGGFQPFKLFAEFIRIGRTKREIQESLRRQQDASGNVNFRFSQPHEFGQIVFQFNLATGETSIRMRDFVSLEHFGGQWFSEYLQANSPFQDQKRVNMLFPMGYRGWVFPLINLVEIRLIKDGKEQVFKHNRGSYKILGETLRKITGITE